MIPPNSMAIIADHFPPAERGRPISILISASFLGPVLAIPLVALLADLGGWRVPFLASALLIIVGLIIRFQVDETPVFQQLRRSKRTVKLPVLEALTKYRRETVIAVGLKITEVAWVGILTVFAVTYLTHNSRPSRLRFERSYSAASTSLLNCRRVSHPR